MSVERGGKTEVQHIDACLPQMLDSMNYLRQATLFGLSDGALSYYPAPLICLFLR